ncbi:MAG: response regulator [Phycisphaerae bacterium]|nr:response regulator [Gemmatimonadaceae bacterium]
MKQLLLVDDDVHVVQALGNILRRRRDSWEVRLACDANEAIREMEAHPADVIISDFQMPGIDGCELMTRIERDWPSTVRIMLTGDTDEAVHRRLVSVTHALLSKPVSSKLLVETMDRVNVVLEYFASGRLRTAAKSSEAMANIANPSPK